SAFVALNQAYFMGLFFFIAGYFVPGALDRKGTWVFLRDRLIRLGIPLVLFCLLISPAIEGVKGMTEGWLPAPLSRAILTRYRDLEFTPGPLWFLEGLLVFSAVYAFGRAAATRVWPGRPDWQQQRPALTQAGLLAGALALTLATFAARIYYPLGAEWQHLQLGAFPQYVLLFAAGILAQRAGWLPEIAAPMRRSWSVVAIVGIVIWLPMMVAAGALDSLDPFLGGFTWQSLLYSAWESFFCVGMVIAFLTLFHGRFNRQGRLVAALAAGAYTVYIIHAPIIVFLTYPLRGVVLYPLLKWALLVPVGVALCFAAAHLVRRLPLATRVL
ncbi:MAG: acyltransferase family protein, partial [Candidatus Promineifilaceae bacterium]